VRILVVDDDPATRLCLSAVLDAAGEVTGAADGEDALAAFGRALDEGRPFGLVCMDIRMPRLDGQAALKGLRALEAVRRVQPGAEAKVVMLSSCDDTRNVCDAFFGGMADGFVRKPLRVAAFRDEMRRLGLALA
jgi:two-component system chemotaxis response regulator CheY